VLRVARAFLEQAQDLLAVRRDAACYSPRHARNMRLLLLTCA
jgi:hypothetical protein